MEPHTCGRCFCRRIARVPDDDAGMIFLLMCLHLLIPVVYLSASTYARSHTPTHLLTLGFTCVPCPNHFLRSRAGVSPIHARCATQRRSATPPPVRPCGGRPKSTPFISTARCRRHFPMHFLEGDGAHTHDAHSEGYRAPEQKGCGVNLGSSFYPDLNGFLFSHPATTPDTEKHRSFDLWFTVLAATTFSNSSALKPYPGHAAA